MEHQGISNGFSRKKQGFKQLRFNLSNKKLGCLLWTPPQKKRKCDRHQLARRDLTNNNYDYIYIYVYIYIHINKESRDAMDIAEFDATIHACLKHERDSRNDLYYPQLPNSFLNMVCGYSTLYLLHLATMQTATVLPEQSKRVSLSAQFLVVNLPDLLQLKHCIFWMKRVNPHILS